MMEVTLSINDALYREVKIEAARKGVSIAKFVEEALRKSIGSNSARDAGIEERNKMMEELLRRTAHFRIGPKPLREEISERQQA